MKKTVSTILMVIGVGLFVFGCYTSYEASQGAMKVSQAQADQAGRRKPLIGPVRKGIRSRMSESAQEKINEASQGVVASRVASQWLQGSGIVLALVGIGGLVFSGSRKRKND